MARRGAGEAAAKGPTDAHQNVGLARGAPLSLVPQLMHHALLLTWGPLCHLL